MYFRHQLLYCFRVVSRTPSPASRPLLKSRGPQRGKRIAQLLVVGFAALVMIDALVGDRGLLARRRARQEYAEQSTRLLNQRRENDRLREEARRLRDDPTAIEELARRELGLMRPGEKVFIVKDLKSPQMP